MNRHHGSATPSHRRVFLKSFLITAISPLLLLSMAHASSLRSTIKYKALKPLADTGAQSLTVYTRSRFFQEQPGAVRELPAITITEDGEERTVEPIYLVDRVDGQKIDGAPLFEYRIELNMPDGKVKKGTVWLESWRLRAPIGRKQVQQSLGE